MFTGIIEAVGKIEKIQPLGGDVKITISTGKMDMSDVKLGDSIACNGVCLTAIELFDNSYVADVSGETLNLTSLGKIEVGTHVNIEKAMRLQDRLGGHLVSGHVDGLGKLISISQDARSWRYKIEAPAEISHYIAQKGSICVNGVSLTVNEVENNVFGINIVPHTRSETTIQYLQIGSLVNLEVDLLARYLERMLTGTEDKVFKNNITPEFLAKKGFM